MHLLFVEAFMQKALSVVKTVLTLGWFGDFNVLRELALRVPAFKYLYYLYIEKHQSYIPLSVKLENDVEFPHLTGINITGGVRLVANVLYISTLQ